MAYRHATVRESYQDLAGGMVLHSAPGFPAFPVRPAGEMFQRALELRGGGPVMVWDPCCGSGYLLTVVALLHRRQVSAVLASDIDDEALRLAERNLGLLSGSGLAARAADLAERARRFDKPSYAAAAQAAVRLQARLDSGGGDLPHAVRRADVFDPGSLRRALAGRVPGVVLADVPYGEQTSWQGPDGSAGVAGMLRAVGQVLPADTVIGVAVRGRKVPLEGGPRPRSSFRIGTRAVALFQGTG